MPLFGGKDDKKDEAKKGDDDKKGDDAKGGDDAKKGDDKAAASGDAKQAPAVCSMKRGDYQIHIYIEQAKEIKMEEAHTVDPMV